MSNEKLQRNLNFCSVITFAIIVRWSVSLHPYSGQNKPPLYGDYEAQRHWMEVTLNLPLEDWYFNTTNNDLMYWGLDYPPLTAYHSYINGKLGYYINPDFVSLHKSRGYESYDHKFFMRATVLIVDLILYIFPIILYFNSIYKQCEHFVDSNYGENEEPKKLNLTNISVSTSVSHLAQIAIALLYPGIILVDHGHFQYNSVSLGLTVLAVTFLVYNKMLASAVSFCLALNYKQMSLYHSLPFFIYMLSKCLQFSKANSLMRGVLKLFVLSFTVLLTFGLIWFPFLKNNRVFFQVLKRLFPLARGIFEDKVSNLWCAVNVFYKLNQISDKILLAKVCTALVLGTSLLSLGNLFRHPTLLRLLLAMINVSLSFFLFSYQVHEKSILLVAVPVILFFPFDPFHCFWFLSISTFSMLPLFLKDDLLVPYISLSILFSLFIFGNVDFHIESNVNHWDNKTGLLSSEKINFLSGILFKLSLIGCFILSVCSVIVKPPARYPDLWPLLISLYSFGHFISFGFYFNFIQITRPLD